MDPSELRKEFGIEEGAVFVAEDWEPDPDFRVPAWNKGIPTLESTKKLQSEWHSQKTLTEKHKKNIGKAVSKARQENQTPAWNKGIKGSAGRPKRQDVPRYPGGRINYDRLRRDNTGSL